MSYRPFSDGPVRTKLLDADYQIKPGKWQMNYGNFLLVGLESPVFEYFVFENNTKADIPDIGFEEPSCTNTTLSGKSISCRVETKKILSLEISCGIQSMIPTASELDSLDNSLNDFLFTMKKSYMYGIYSLTRVISPTHDMSIQPVTWIIRGNEIINDLQSHRDRRIKKILEDE